MASLSVSARAHLAWIMVALGIASCAVAPPLSGPRYPAATVRPVPQPVPAVPAPILPAPSLASPASAPSSVETRPLSPAPSIRVVGSDAIALVLPLQSPTYAQAAEAVKAGFLAAANRAGAGRRVQVIAHGNDGVLPAFALADRSGVALVVGPLTRDDLKTVVAMTLAHPRMLALNQTDDGAPMPADTYSLALSVESDAVLLARVAGDSGVRTLAVVSSDEPLPRRFASSFVAAWERGPSREYRFDPNPEMLGLLRRELAARPPDAVVLAVDGSDAALARTFLPPRPVFALSQIADGLPAQALRDLEGARYVEIPWIAEPDDPVFSDVPRANLGSPLLERLYALGLDAFALAQMLAEPVPPERVEIDGATGHLSLTPARVFSREGRVMLIHDGRVQTDPAVQ